MIEVKKDMIGCLVWVWNIYEFDAKLAILNDIVKAYETSPHPYLYKANGIFYNYCRPVKLEEIKFYKEK